MSVAAQCLQVMLALFNIAFFVMGILVATVSGYLLQNSASGDAHAAGTGFAVVGALMIVIGFFGFIGAFCRQRFALILYVLLIGVIFILSLIGGSVSVSVANNLNRVSNISQQVWNDFSDNQKQQYQLDHSCCGYHDPMDNSVNFGQCFADGRLSGCEPNLEGDIQNFMKQSGIYMFIGAFCELVAGIIAVILIVDENKRRSGYGRSF